MEPATPVKTTVSSTAAAGTDYAGFGQRLVSYLVDSFIYIGIPYGIFLVVALVLGAAMGVSTISPTQSTLDYDSMTEASSAGASAALGISILSLLVMFAVSVVLYFWMLSKNGQTLGKKIMKIKIVKLDEAGVPKMGTLLLRELAGRFVSGIIPLAIGYLWMLSDEKKQTLHDKIAGTVVVKA